MDLSIYTYIVLPEFDLVNINRKEEDGSYTYVFYQYSIGAETPIETISDYENIKYKYSQFYPLIKRAVESVQVPSVLTDKEVALDYLVKLNKELTSLSFEDKVTIHITCRNTKTGEGDRYTFYIRK